MDARPKTVRDILHTGDQYIIPLFQRYYSWQKTHWERLRKDIWALMEDDAKPVHFLGPLVCTPTAHYPGAVPAYQLIDGQQRLTTLTLLLAAVRDVAVARNIADLPEELTEDYLLHKRKQGMERYKVLPRLGDREALTTIVEGGDTTPYAESGVFHAWKYFKRHAEHWAREESDARLRQLVDTVTRRLALVVVTIEGENPYEIFESLNSKGLPLEEGDLIRNFVFMQVPLSGQQEFFDKHWKALEDMFAATDSHEAVPMTPFYRDYLMRRGTYSKEDATFLDFKKQQKDAALTPEQQVKELLHYASLDLMLRRPRTVGGASLRRLLCWVEAMEMATAYPLLLALLDRNHRGQLSDSDLDGCLLDIVSFVLRRSICGETTRQYNKWFADAIGVIKDDPRTDLQQYWLRRRWPDDSALCDRLISFPIYRRESRKARVILESIEESYGHKEKVDLGTLSIEHVMPQTIGKNTAGKSWQAALGDGWQALHDQWLHTLGNLTLTGYNPDLSNAAFDKKKAFLSSSHLELNRHFEALSVWTVDEIKKRAVALAEVVARLWPRPVSDVVYAASAEALPEPEGMTDRKKRQLEYWRHLDVRLEDRGIPQDMIQPQPSTCIDVPIGVTDSVDIEMGFLQQNKRLYVSLVLAGDVGEAIAVGLVEMKAEIERETGYQVEWSEGEISVVDEDISVWDRDDWPVQHDWIGDRLMDFMRVFKPRVEALEKKVLEDPKLRQQVEDRRMLVAYWTACANVFAGARLCIRVGDAGRGRHYCRFEQPEQDVSPGVWYSKKHQMLGVYFRVGSRAPTKTRTAFREVTGAGLQELKTAIGPGVELDDPYLVVSQKAVIDDPSIWRIQHEWLRIQAEKLMDELAPRLGLELP